MTPGRRSLRLALAAAAAVLLAACGGAAADNVVADPAARVSASGDTATLPTLLAAVPAIDAEFDAAELAGRDTVLWFWAPWCTICRAEAPEVAAAADRFGDDVEIIGVAGRGRVGEMRGFIDSTGTGAIVHLADETGGVWNEFGIFAQPAFAFIDGSGATETFIGGLSADDLIERIEDLIAA